MDTQTIAPKTTEEHVVWNTIRATYLFYAAGALYIVAPVMAWLMMALFAKRLWKQGWSHPGFAMAGIPFAIQLWIGGMFVLLVVLVIAHFDYQLGVAMLIKSSIGWAKGWALLALFPLLGCLQIRPEIIYRASMHVCLHTCLLLPLFVGAWMAGLPELAYVSPLKIVGGPGIEFFAVSLYEIDPGSGSPRWRLFTPWAPALGFVANICFVFALQEKDEFWRWSGIAGSILMILMSGSRLALVAIVVVWLSTGVIGSLRNPCAPFVGAVLSAFCGATGVKIYDAFDSFWRAFRAARAASTRVRDALARIAVDRWSSESPVWGHGIVERGPHLVEFMPIGSHHSWYGLLFVKGAVGAAALAVPMIFSFIQLAWRCNDLRIARVGVAMILLLFLYTFGENLEILAYLIWPALMMVGVAHREVSLNPEKVICKTNDDLHGETDYA